MPPPSTTLLERSNVTILGSTSPGAQTIVFLHSLGSTQNMWRLLTPAFEEQYRVVLLDLISAGNSGQMAYSHTTPSTLNDHASDLLCVLRAQKLNNVVFVGHSVGAMIGILAAIREPERFAKMVLISPSPRFLNERVYAGGFEQSDISELLDAMECDCHGWPTAATPVTGQDERPELVMELTNSFVRNNPEIARHFARVALLSDSRAELPFLTIPTLILQSARDVVAPLAVGHYINEQLADSHIVVVETGGHCPHLSAPQETLAAVDTFLQRKPMFE